MPLILLGDSQPVERIGLSLVNWLLIGLMVAGFGWRLTHPGAAADLALMPSDLLRPGLHLALALLAYPFLEPNFIMLGLNVWALWIFGNNVEDDCGHGRFALFWLIAALAGAGAQAALGPDVAIAGAGPAVFAVMAAYLLAHPHARTLVLLFGLVRLWVLVWPAWRSIAFYLFMATLLALQPWLPGPDIFVTLPWWGLLGGALAGPLLILLLRRPDVTLLQNPPDRLSATQEAPLWAQRVGCLFSVFAFVVVLVGLVALMAAALDVETPLKALLPWAG